MASNGNFCTMNPLHRTSGNVSYSNGNLTYSPSSSWTTTTWTRGNFVIPKDKKIYMELYHKTQSGYYASYGFATNLSIPTAEVDGNGFVGVYNGAKKVNGTGTNSYMTVPVQGDIVQLAIDGSNNKVWIGLNNTWQGSGDPANGSNETGTINTSNALGYDVTFASTQNSISVLTANFGQDSTFAGTVSAGGNADANGFGDFKYAPPSGYVALSTANLPISDDIDPAQTDDDIPQKQFNVVTYTGNGSTQNITGLGFQPDFVWVKKRSSGSNQDPRMFDSSRGVNKFISSITTDAEVTDSGTLTAFGSDGFTSGSNANMNNNGSNYVAWCWRANGGTTASNSEGSITATVQANQAAGFSIVTYTGGNGSWGATNTYGHGLSQAPEFIITKERSIADEWSTFHAHVGNGGGSNAAANNLVLNTSAALYTNQSYKAYAGVMPTSSLVTVEGNTTNDSSQTHVAYCWHSVEGYSKFGSWEGNANNDGPFIYTGFRPRMFFIKSVDTQAPWTVYDGVRDGFNNPPNSPAQLFWDESLAEHTSYGLDIYSNGFKLRTSNATVNASGTWVFGAWGDVPFKYNNTF